MKKILACAALVVAAAAASAANYPFGARLDPYAFGTKPSQTAAQMDQSIQSNYNGWKSTHIWAYNQNGLGTVAKWNQWQTYITSSEAMGYAMLVTVVMAGNPGQTNGDPNAQATFDGLVQTARARPAYALHDAVYCAWQSQDPNLCTQYNGDDLMEWRLGPNGEAGAGDGWNAMDGDLDIALALLMADRQWGSSGTYNYKALALQTIYTLKARNFNPDGTMKSCRDYTANASRTSDYMIGHFRSFKAATGDAFWDTVISKTLSIASTVQNANASGLLPDWIRDQTTNPQPVPDNSFTCEGNANEGDYWYNAQRDPWRFGADYVFSGDPQVQAIQQKFANFFWNAVGTDHSPGDGTGYGDTWTPKGDYADGYKLDGTPINVNTGPSRGVGAGALVAAMVNPQYQTLLDTTWDWLNVKWINDYYDSDLPLLAQIVASGNWWRPEGTGTSSGGGTTGLTIEAEDAARTSDLTVASNVPGYTGTGFVSYGGTGTVTATFTNVAAGTYNVKLRYHAYTQQHENVSINGGAAIDTYFPATDPNWNTVTIANVQLPAGTNTVAVSAGWGYIDLDSIQLEAAGAPMTVMASSGQLLGTLTVRTDPSIPGYDTNFVGDFSNASDRLNLTFNNVAAGTYTITIKYHAWTQQQNYLIVNNGTPQLVSFPPVGTNGAGWGAVQVTSQVLNAGTNTISITPSWGYIDVNWVQITKTN